MIINYLSSFKILKYSADVAIIKGATDTTIAIMPSIIPAREKPFTLVDLSETAPITILSILRIRMISIIRPENNVDGGSEIELITTTDKPIIMAISEIMKEAMPAGENLDLLISFI
jgi:hypothetical protein